MAKKKKASKAKATKAKPKKIKKAKVKKAKAKKAKAKPKKVRPIPEGYHTATSYLVVNGAANAIDFYKRAFGAKEVLRMGLPDGKIMHAEIKIGNSPIMLADEAPDRGARGPHALGGTPVSTLLYVEDVDALAAQAVAAGARQVRPVEDQFYGDRAGTFADPFGHVWTIATHVEDVPEEEMAERARAAMPPPKPEHAMASSAQSSFPESSLLES
jgi:PhnB protein